MPHEFFAYSRDIAQRFLHSAVVIDDRAFEDPTSPPQSGLVPPVSRGAVDLATPPDAALVATDSEASGHDLDSQAVIKGFARQGIACSVLRPQATAEGMVFDAATKKLALITDILVLDWSLGKDEGETVIEFIREIVSGNIQENPANLRLIVIYTGEDFGKVTDKLVPVLRKLSSEPLHSEDNGLSHHIGAIRITMLAKHLRNAAGHADRQIGFDALGARAVEEFTRMTAGLLSNVALEALAQIRLNAHKILSRFNPEMDAPYLNHRLCQSEPADAEAYATYLLAGELHDLVHEYEVGQKADIKAIEKWLARPEAPKSFVLGKQHTLDTEGMREVLETGLDKSKQVTFSRKVKDNIHKQGTQLFSAADQEETTKADQYFAELTSLRTSYRHRLPVLTLGSLLIQPENNVYYLCIQPRCDSVRLQEPRTFPFLPLKPPDEKKPGFDLIVQAATGEYLHLKIIGKPHACRMLTFTPDDTGVVSASQVEEKMVFKSENQQFIWLGELKFEFAQKILNAFAATLARVGTDDYEWLRRHGG